VLPEPLSGGRLASAAGANLTVNEENVKPLAGCQNFDRQHVDSSGANLTAEGA
jgi:hypothetical protein